MFTAAKEPPASNDGLTSSTVTKSPIRVKKKGLATKEKCSSAIHEAIKETEQGHAQGLMQYMKPVAQDDFREQMKNLDKTLDEQWKNIEEYKDMVDIQRKLKVREANAEWKRKSRQARYDAEIAHGDCSPGGTKWKLKVCHSCNDQNSKLKPWISSIP